MDVRLSLIEGAGNGVFADRNYKRGDFVCFFDGDPIAPEDINADNFSRIVCGPHGPILGHKNAMREAGTGQLVNDAEKFTMNCEDRDEFGHFVLSNPTIEARKEHYLRASKEKANIMFKNDSLSMFATRDITQGEELYMHYGLNLWLSELQEIYKCNPLDKLYFYVAKKELQIVGDQIAFKGQNVPPHALLIEIGITNEKFHIIEQLGLMDIPIEEAIAGLFKIVLVGHI